MTLAAVQARTGATFIPPYDSVNTILGQGTALVELVEQIPEKLAAVVAPVGGGGLLAGTALAADGTGIRVFGAEPAGADDCARGLQEGTRIPDVDAHTIADGLRTPVGVLNFPIIQEKVEKVITVTDEVRAVWSWPNTVLSNPPAGNHRGHATHVGTHEDCSRTQRGGVVRCDPEFEVSGAGHRGPCRDHHQRWKR